MEQDQNPVEKKVEKKAVFESATMKTFAVLGLIVILGLGLWGSVQVVRIMPNVYSVVSKKASAAAVSISSLFISAEKMDLTANAGSVNSGEVVTLSWQHTGGRPTDGTYSLSLSCLSGVTIKTDGTNGTSTPIACNVPTTLKNVSRSDSVKVIALSTANRFTDVPFTVTFTPKDTTKSAISAKTTVTIVNMNVPSGMPTTGTATSTTATSTTSTTTTTPVTTKPVTPVKGQETTDVRQISGGTTTPANNPNGQADLAVTFTDFGYLDSATNVFVSSTTPSVHGKVAVKFSIANIGTKETGTWQFSAPLPTTPPYTYVSNAQPSLMPGDRIEYTLAFDEANQSTTTLQITVNADNRGTVNESNKANNIVTRSFTVSK
jgi:hypothetical protein